jgi:hypothetical protein
MAVERLEPLRLALWSMVAWNIHSTMGLPLAPMEQPLVLNKQVEPPMESMGENNSAAMVDNSVMVTTGANNSGY